MCCLLNFYQEWKLKSIVSDTFMSLFRFPWSHLLPRPQLFAQPQPAQQPTDSIRARASLLSKGDQLQAGLWLLLPLLDLGEYHTTGLGFPNSLQWAFMMRPRNAGVLMQEGNLDQWETDAEGGAGPMKALFPPLMDCSEACPSGGSLQSWAVTMANQLAVLFQEAVGDTGIYHLALFPSSPASVPFFLILTALGL